MCVYLNKNEKVGVALLILCALSGPVEIYASRRRDGINDISINNEMHVLSLSANPA